MKTLIYDCETKRAIPTPGKLQDPTFEYCNGWGDYRGMGISVIGYQLGDEEPQAALSVDCFVDYLLKIEAAGEQYSLVGFDSIQFDDRLLKAHGVYIQTKYDLLVETRAAAGYLSFRKVPKGHSYKLDTIARANGMAKNFSGDMAPLKWQRGERQEVIDYCKSELVIMRTLLNLGLAGNLIDPNTGKKLTLSPLY